MQKEMIYRLPMPFTHTTPIDHDDMSFSQVVHSKNLPKSRRPNKESYFHRSFGSPNALPRKGMSIVTCKDLIEGFNIKLSFAGRNPPNLVFPLPCPLKGI
jgi:hypothetical protein